MDKTKLYFRNVDTDEEIELYVDEACVQSTYTEYYGHYFDETAYHKIHGFIIRDMDTFENYIVLNGHIWRQIFIDETKIRNVNKNEWMDLIL